MTGTPLLPVERSVRRARRRLVVQSLVGKLTLGWAAALALAVGWVVLEPFAVADAPGWLRWAVLGGLVGVGTVAAGVWAAAAAPSRERAALEFDTRFDLKERVTTALGLPAADRNTPAGQAVLADAAARVAAVRVGEKFPVRPGRLALAVPALAGLLALAVYFPVTPSDLAAEDAAGPNGKKAAERVAAAADPAKKTQPILSKQALGRDKLDRPNKSAALKELERDLDKLTEKYARDDDKDPARAREKVTEMTALEEKVKKFEEEKFQKLSQLDQQLRELEKLAREKEFSDGPAKELADALAKGDLKKAGEAADELKKKAKDGKLDKADLAKLDKQLDAMKKEMERLAQSREKEQKLKDLIEKAKTDGKSAETLERELDKLKAEGKQASKEMEQLAQRMEKMKEAMQKGDMDQLQNELDQLGQQLENVGNELQDLEDADEYLQRLKDGLKKACQQCEGDKPGDGEPKEKDGAKWTPFGQPGAGKRDENKDAKTGSGSEERIKGLFDPKGRKSYGGAVNGPSFKKLTDDQIAREVKDAAQEAPKAIETQRLPRGAKDAVRQYYEKIGNTGPGK